VKDAIAYYKSDEPIPANADGYGSIDQTNPGETHVAVAFSTVYYSTYSDPDIRAFSERGVLPISFVTLKPSFFSQLWTWQSAFAICLMWTILNTSGPIIRTAARLFSAQADYPCRSLRGAPDDHSYLQHDFSSEMAVTNKN
jgi:hypothetical protein